MTFAAAHRGLSSEHPENTLRAFRAAIDAGFRCLELDLRLTTDKQLVVFHDRRVERTTDGSGRVSRLSLQALQNMSTGAEPVIRLEDLLREFSSWDGLWNLEVKALHGTNEALALVELYGLSKRALVSSMNPASLARAKRLHPGVPRGFIARRPVNWWHLRAAKGTGCTWINVPHDKLDAKRVARVRREGLRLGVYTVNSPTRAMELAALGVDCIITDRAQVLGALDGSQANF